MSATQETLIKTGKFIQAKFIQLSKVVNNWLRTRSLTLKLLVILAPLLMMFFVMITPFPNGSTLNNDWNGLSYAASYIQQQGYQVTQIYNTPQELSSYRIPGILIIHHVTRSYTTDEINYLLELARNGWGIFIAEEINSELTRAFNIKVKSFVIREENTFVDNPTQPLVTPAPTMNLSTPLNVFVSEVRPLEYSSSEINFEPILTTSNNSWLDLDANGVYDPLVDQLGPFTIGVRFGYGQGRIVFMSDYTWLQNQIFNQYDNPAFLVTLLDWLGEAIFNTIGTKPMVYFDESHLGWTTFKPQTLLHSISLAQSLLLQNVVIVFIYFIIAAPITFYQFSSLVNRYIELRAKPLKEVKGESTFLQKKQAFLESIKNPVTRFEVMFYKVLLKWLSMDPYFNFNWISNDPALERVETLTFLGNYLSRLYQVNQEVIQRSEEFSFKNLQELKEKTFGLFKFAYKHEIFGPKALDERHYLEFSTFCYQLAVLINKDKKKLL